LKSDDEAVFTPSDFIQYLAETRKVKVENLRLPNRLIMTYHRRIYEDAKRLVNGGTVDWWIYGDTRPFCVGKANDVEVGVGCFWVGAPAAVMTLEEVIACGVSIIFEVGFCGGLQPFVQPGSILVVNEAIRDEGTSGHYLPTNVPVKSSIRLRKKLIECLNKEKIKYFAGSVWSTDGVYRETRGKFRKFKKEGVLGVDMETSSIFALARYRNVEAASTQIVSDILTETEWQTHFFGHEQVRKNSKILIKTVVEAISGS